VPKLQYIQVAATGYNNIDLAAAKSRNIPVSNISGYSTTSVAQQTFAMLLGYLNQTETYASESRDGKWSSQTHFSYWHSPIEELSGKKLGIIGLGTIGRKVAKIGRAFGMTITSVTRGPEKDILDYVDYLDEETFYQTADVLSLHCPLNDQTIGLINATKLKMMKPSSILKAPNCHITPHQAWASLQSRQRLLEGIISNIKAFIKGNPQNVVNL